MSVMKLTDRRQSSSAIIPFQRDMLQEINECFSFFCPVGKSYFSAFFVNHFLHQHIMMLSRLNDQEKDKNRTKCGFLYQLQLKAEVQL